MTKLTENNQNSLNHLNKIIKDLPDNLSNMFIDTCLEHFNAGLNLLPSKIKNTISKVELRNEDNTKGSK